MVAAAPVEVEFSNQNLGDVMFLVSLVHKVRTDMLSHRRVKNFLLDRGMDFQLVHRLGDDPFFLSGGFCFLELVEKILDGVVILLED